MSGLSQAVRNFRSLWGQGDEDYENEEEIDTSDLPTPSAPSAYAASSHSYSSSSSQRAVMTPAHGGGGAHGGSNAARRLRVVDSPLRRREKNIYTIKPKDQEDAALAADCLKTGDAVIVNLEHLDRNSAVRIIDFMSGVCYGLEGGGHAMKLGDLIFLYTPGDFEIRSDEADYGENEAPFFKDVQPISLQHGTAGGAPAGLAGAGVSPSGYTNPAHLPVSPTAAAAAAAAAAIGTVPSGYVDARRPWER